MSSMRTVALLALLLAVGCGGAPSRPDATGGSAVPGALTLTDAGWRFQPGGRGGEPLPVPADVVAVIDQLIAGEATPDWATLVLAPGGHRVVGWRCVGCGGGAPDDADWAIHGNEPFWGLVIRGGSALWTTPDQDGALSLRARPGPDGRWTLTGDGVTMSLRIEEMACGDGMADARWHATAHIDRDGVELRGCAMRGQ